MIAAVQTNDSTLKRIYPEKMIGIKFDADCLYFYSTKVTKSYLNELVEGDRPEPLVVNKFPKDKELSLSMVDDRKEIFMYLSALRKYALSLEASVRIIEHLNMFVTVITVVSWRQR